MGDTPVAIEAHIAEKRAELGRNLEEIEQRVRGAVDWKRQARDHPDLVLAIAFSVGRLLGMIPALRRG